MKRREFLGTTIPAAVAMPALLNGFSFTAHSKSENALGWLLGQTTDTDHVETLSRTLRDFADDRFDRSAIRRHAERQTFRDGAGKRGRCWSHDLLVRRDCRPSTGR